MLQIADFFPEKFFDCPGVFAASSSVFYWKPIALRVAVKLLGFKKAGKNYLLKKRIQKTVPDQYRHHLKSSFSWFWLPTSSAASEKLSSFLKYLKKFMIEEIERIEMKIMIFE